MHITKKLKTSHGVCREGGILLLPDELLWTITGFLDEQTLLTARLVCKQFCKPASSHFKSLNIKCAELDHASTSTLLSLSGLKHLEVFIHLRNRLPLLAHPKIAPFVTHVRLSMDNQPREEWREVLHPLRLLPQLHSLSLEVKLEPTDLDIIQMLPLNLQELELPYSPLEDASPLTRFSGLTHLGIRVEEVKAAPSLVSLTGLLSLRSLELHCGSVPLGVLKSLTTLTSLKLNMDHDADEPGTIFPYLAHLSGLSQLIVWGAGAVTLDDLACLSHLTKLTSLGMWDCDDVADCASSSALAPLTGLVCVDIPDIIGESLLPHLRVETLESLVLSESLQDFSFLQRATRLTELSIGGCLQNTYYPQDVGPTIAKLSRLRSLSLYLSEFGDFPSTGVFPLSHILQALTCLTYLDYCGCFTVGDDLQACASLPLLRSLGLRDTREVTAAYLPVLQGMSSLTELELWRTGILPEELTPEVRAAFDVDRLSRGWAPLMLNCGPPR